LLETSGVSSCRSWAARPSVMAKESMSSVQPKKPYTITPHRERNPPGQGDCAERAGTGHAARRGQLLFRVV
jgi:hypothetical protein